MFFKKKINNYNYVICIQTNGSVIKIFDSISYSFVTNLSYYLKFYLSSINYRHNPFLKLNLLFLPFFIRNKANYFYLFNLFFSKKLMYNNIDLKNFYKNVIVSSILFRNNLIFNLNTNKENVLSNNKECAIFNNLFILKILNNYNKKIISNFFFNI